MTRFSGVVYGICLVLIGLFCYLAHLFNNLPGDIIIISWLQGIHLPFFNQIMEAVSYVASLIPAIVIVALISGGLWATGRKIEAIFTASLTSSAALLDWLLKLLISRPRPESELLQSLRGDNSYSFPSGHLAYAVVFYGFLFYLLPRLTKQPAIIWVLWPVLILLIVLTGASRVYLGAHWPSDVLGSLFLGGLLLAPAIILYNNYAKGHQIKVAHKYA